MSERVTEARRAYDRARDRLDAVRAIEIDVLAEEAAVEQAWLNVVAALAASPPAAGEPSSLAARGDSVTVEEFNVFVEAMVRENLIVLRPADDAADPKWECFAWAAENFPWHGATPFDLLRTLFRDPESPEALAAMKSLNEPAARSHPTTDTPPATTETRE